MTHVIEKTLRFSAVWLLLLVGGSLVGAWGQDTFDPDSPPEPSARFRVTVASANGYVSGSGIYESGQTVHISTSAQSADYTFAYWTLNGERYVSEPLFDYVVKDRSVCFEAVYDFTPVDPSEPQTPNTYRLYLTTNEEGGCSFSRGSGDKAEGGSYVSLTAYPSQGYQFRGWYLNGVKLSESLSFGYYMPKADVTLETRFVYSPDSPDEPSGDGSQTGNVTKNKRGDVNGDGVADVADVVKLINMCLNNE